MLGKVAIGDLFTVLVVLICLIALFRWTISNPLPIAVRAALGYGAYALLHPTWLMIR